ncbi:hypothetical protein cypCar_00023204 [Cyprinus carpio]|nr:hypothetical protein cypCar_00023204 [Cyprinus carpio]
MTTPAEKLSLCERRAQSLADSEEYDPCMQELVRCLALNRLVYGNEHFAVAQAQSRLAKAYLQYKEAESSFQKAEIVMGDIVAQEAMGKEDRVDIEYEIFTNLARVYQRQGRPEKALSQCERALELLQEGAHLSQICCVYRNMAAIEQAQGHLDRAT